MRGVPKAAYALFLEEMTDGRIDQISEMARSEGGSAARINRRVEQLKQEEWYDLDDVARASYTARVKAPAGNKAAVTVDTAGAGAPAASTSSARRCPCTRSTARGGSAAAAAAAAATAKGHQWHRQIRGERRPCTLYGYSRLLEGGG